MQYKFFIKVTANTLIKTQLAPHLPTLHKQITFEFHADTPMEAFNQIEKYVDDYDQIIIACPKAKGIVTPHPRFVTGTALVENGERTYRWQHR